VRLATTLKAEGVALALYKMTGRRPKIEDIAGRARVYWDSDDLPVVRAWFEDQVSRAAIPPDVSIDLLPVVGPYAAKSAAPAVILTLAVGVILGRYL
jgi:hypothetical protein